MATSARQAAAPIIGLFREVLKLHRERLPPPMRVLGDAYVREEFRSHLRAKNPVTEAQWQAFVQEWRTYVATLRGDEQALPGTQVGTVSGELASGEFASLSADQRKRMELLQKELAKEKEPEGGRNQ
ncbi:hypothetical protein HYH03_000725 [Edaphochlamys debaryana]|uniref:Succinate dehydrogenase assembly factor 3 n=1 Tax=Edaphochlamys debaryana TaxID=47281 RepID=A0A836C7P7_9CHLO|nr:hypothetical protein HYH03_000725 [Edaphochlamys debaryana]|eukprot:KAG2502239.1 hypothetical protein HYH03_000725 [Edaphochlamys debaryana]